MTCGSSGITARCTTGLVVRLCSGWCTPYTSLNTRKPSQPQELTEQHCQGIYTYSMCVSVPVCLALCAYICTVCRYVRVYVHTGVRMSLYFCIFLFNVLIGICSLCYASCSTFTSFVIMNRLSGEGGRGDKVQLSPSIIHHVFPLLLPLPLCLSQSGNEH